MRFDARRLLPLFLIALVGGGLVWALTFEPFEPAEFTFINGTEIQSVDPAKVTGVPEGRILNALFEGLYRQLPVEGEPNSLEPQPALATGHTLSDDGLTYTFTIRDDAWWTRLNNGEVEKLRLVTAEDFRWSWKRFLAPETACQYAYQLYYVKNARKFGTGSTALKIGDRVEIEESNRENPTQQYPTGTMYSGVLVEQSLPQPEFSEDTSEEEQQEAINEWLEDCIWTVEIKTEIEGQINWDATGVRKQFCLGDTSNKKNVIACESVLLHFSEVGIRAPDDHTFIVELENPTGYFLHLCAFYPMYPVNRECVEEHGVPNWTKTENIVTCGPFVLEFRRIRDRIRLARNPHYWGADDVNVETIDALPVSNTTGFNMYMNGQADWMTTVPATILPDVLADPALQDDIHTGPLLGVYFYRFNTTRAPLNDPRVRRALNMAVDKEQICEFITRGGQIPARNLVPPLTGYEPSLGDDYNPQEARRLLDEAIADGVEMRKLQFLANSGSGHVTLALTIADQWRKHLGIEVEIRELEWGVMLNEVRQMNYDIARAGWLGDYPDPNTFLDMFVTGGENNETGWSSAPYDDLIQQAAAEVDPQRRMEMLSESEAIFVDEMPIMPLYFYVSVNLVRPFVEGFQTNVQDIHPLQLIDVNQEEKQRWLSGEDR